jgi:2-dehydro-3-deoxyphosphogluconate aldolase/(4S)-4-hydroxy-2-oxoglutarate aldolase
MILGVGSIEDAATTAVYILSGANFIVSPILILKWQKSAIEKKSPGCPDAVL